MFITTVRQEQNLRQNLEVSWFTKYIVVHRLKPYGINNVELQEIKSYQNKRRLCNFSAGRTLPAEVVRFHR